MTTYWNEMIKMVDERPKIFKEIIDKMHESCEYQCNGMYMFPIKHIEEGIRLVLQGNIDEIKEEANKSGHCVNIHEIELLEKLGKGILLSQK